MTRATVFLSLVLLASGAQSASFDCQKASSRNDRMICDDAELSRLDDEVGVAYKEALRKASSPKELIANQREAWKLRERECSTKACLADWFVQRLAYLGTTAPKLAAKTPAPTAQLAAAQKALADKDYPSAFESFKQLAEQGDSEAQASLGLMYERGQGADKDLAEAFKWYRSAAAQGVAWAQTNLALAYANGRGTEKDDKQANKWFRSAALKGNTRAQELLGNMYVQGRGIPEGRKEAVELIRPSNLMYIAKLDKDYRKRIRFGSPSAERAVRDFNIDCKTSQGNGHFLPLINLLYARLASTDREDMWLETAVEERGGEVRISDSLRTPKEVVDTRVVFEINKWGDLRPVGSIKAEAVRNACFNSQGPIWLID